MKFSQHILLSALLAALAPVYGATVATALSVEQKPYAEQLHYNVVWPSGLSLGEASLSLAKTPAEPGRPGGGIQSELALDAAIPGFQVADRYTSRATGNYCSESFDKRLRHGPRQADEAMTFDRERGIATRSTLTASHERGIDLGETNANVPTCAKDALTYLSFLRSELAAGRLPQEQPVFFGAAYDVKVEFGGAETVKVGEAAVDADRVNVLLKGPKSQVNFAVFFARDEVRTPVLVRVPLAMGTFSMELAKP